MELHAGLPYWIAKNPLYNYYHPLKKDISVEVLIIGSGITGALVAHELCEAGIQCAILDKRSIANGSTIATTALLQYEIDTPLCELVKIIGEKNAVSAYKACLQSITDLEKVFETINYNPDYSRVPSVFYASNKKGVNLIKKEYIIRRKHNLPVTYLNKRELAEKYGFKAGGALENQVSAQVDAYAAATHLIDYHKKNSRLDVYTHTEISRYKSQGKGCELYTSTGNKVKAKYVVIAAGFEAGKFLPEKVMKLTSTYAIISQPLDEKYIWKDHSLLWETKDPYLYIRTATHNRIMVGGEDIKFKSPEIRDALLRRKVKILEKKFHKLFPSIPFITDMVWCGTFSSTPDGLPFIGEWPGQENMFYTLGYGGNGITFSMIAAQLIRNKLLGITDEREPVFGFER